MLPYPTREPHDVREEYCGGVVRLRRDYFATLQLFSHGTGQHLVQQRVCSLPFSVEGACLGCQAVGILLKWNENKIKCWGLKLVWPSVIKPGRPSRKQGVNEWLMLQAQVHAQGAWPRVGFGTDDLTL